MADDDDDDIDTAEEYNKDFTERFNKLFHAAVKERDQRFEAKFNKLIDSKIEGVTKSIEEGFAKFSEKQTPAAEPKPGEPTKHSQLSPEIDARLKAAENAAKEAKATAEKWEKEATSAKEASRIQEERQMITAALTGKVKPTLIDMVVDRIHAKHLVRDPETNAILWKGDDGTLPFKEGTESFMKSDFGKEVQSPKEVRGGGNRGPENAFAIKPGEMTEAQLGDIIAGSIPR
jgi:hypothetical protein